MDEIFPVMAGVAIGMLMPARQGRRNAAGIAVVFPECRMRRNGSLDDRRSAGQLDLRADRHRAGRGGRSAYVGPYAPLAQI